jgi:DNA-binding GntR family transcriptional regulator
LTFHQRGGTIRRVSVTTRHAVAPRHPTMAEAALAELQESILSGELAPGAPLRLEELAERLGMSISPVREAVRRLETLGLAVHVPHRGARVAELALDDLHDTYEVRLVLETLAVSKAAESFTESDAALARDHLDEYGRAREHDDAREARVAHTAFHFVLYEASGSEWLVRLIRPAWENCERYRSLSLHDLIWVDRQREHERILDACVRHEPGEAALELRRHLTVTANLVARQMGRGDLFE